MVWIKHHCLNISIQLIKNQDRKLVGEMIKREGDIDLLIPRGGKV